VDERARLLFGRSLQDREWGELVGAPDGAGVEVLASPATGYRHGVQLLVHHPWFMGPAVRYVFWNVDRQLAMLNDSFWVREDAPPGVGTRVFVHQVLAAQALGVGDILVEAAGALGSTMNGYYTWARLGFDGLIPVSVLRRLPPNWEDAVSVLDLIDRQGGAEWWRRNGRTFLGTFDLREPSRSLRILRGYTEEKGIVV